MCRIKVRILFNQASPPLNWVTEGLYRKEKTQNNVKLVAGVLRKGSI